MTTSSSVLPYDLIARVLEHCLDTSDYDSLFRCSSVNWTFNRAASRLLYRRVVLDPPDTGAGAGAGGQVLDLKLRDGGMIPKTSNFDSACLPHNRVYVTSLKISGYISPRPPPRNSLPQKLSFALSSSTFVNLSHVELTPKTYHESLFDGIVPLLVGLEQLSEIVVNASCTDDAHADELVKVGVGGRLRKMTLVSPGRKMLQLLPDWLEKLSTTLIELHLTNNCGSITPGVLRSFIPFVKDTLEGFTLGLSYSLTNQDVFDFLTHLTKLRRLHLQYYWAQQQLKPPDRLPRLPSLQSFRVTYPAGRYHTRLGVDTLDKWVRWVVARSPDLEAVCLRYEGEPESLSARPTTRSAEVPAHDNEDDSSSILDGEEDEEEEEEPEPAYVSHDALADHLSGKHWTRLTILDLGSAFVRVDKVVLILETCTLLEELSITVARCVLTMLATRPPTLSTLRAIALRIVNAPKPRGKRSLFRMLVDESQVLQVMKNYQPSLYRFSVNGRKWEARWKIIQDGDDSGRSGLVAQRIYDVLPPWDRKS